MTNKTAMLPVSIKLTSIGMDEESRKDIMAKVEHAMELYADQVAMDFAQWVSNNGYTNYDKYKWTNDDCYTHYSLPDLITLFNKSK